MRPEGLSKMEIIHSSHRVSNPRPTGLYHSALTTTLPRLYIYIYIYVRIIYIELYIYLELIMTRGSAVCTATGYGLDNRGVGVRVPIG
jgi:hypothetical protein